MSSWVGGNKFLSMEEMTINANYIYPILIGMGWSKNAICGVMGNLQSESSINPQIWEGLNEGNLQGGYGLVQWTPATKYINWANENGLTYGEMDSQIKRIQYEVENNIQWSYASDGTPPPYSFLEFTKQTKPPYDLAMEFIKFYERPLEPNQPWRGEQANHWFEVLSGDPIPPTPTGKIKLKNMIWYNQIARISGENDFDLIKDMGNVSKIQNTKNKRFYLVLTSNLIKK